MESPSDLPFGHQTRPRTFSNSFYVPQADDEFSFEGCTVSGGPLILAPAIRYIYDGCPIFDLEKTVNPGTWVMRGDFLKGDVALYSLSLENFSVNDVYQVKLMNNVDIKPDFQNAVMGVMNLDPGMFDLPKGEKTVFFALDNNERVEKGRYSLWVGGIKEGASYWRNLNSQLPIEYNMKLNGAKFIPDVKNNRLLLIAESLTDSRGRILNNHPVYAFYIEKGYWKELRSIELPERLKGYSVVLNSKESTLMILGGKFDQYKYSHEVYKISLSDLNIKRLKWTLPDIALRSDANTAFALRAGKIIFSGGERRGDALSDVWKIDASTGELQRVTSKLGRVQKGFVGVDPTGNKLYFGREMNSYDDPYLHFISLDSKYGKVEPVVLMK